MLLYIDKSIRVNDKKLQSYGAVMYRSRFQPKVYNYLKKKNLNDYVLYNRSGAIGVTANKFKNGT